MKAQASIFILGLLFFCLHLKAQTNNGIVINELMPSNKEAVADEAGDFDDWIELYNNGDVPFNLSGYGLSDDIDNLGKYKFPDGTIVIENGYLIVWADDDQEQGPLHTQFKLSATGESIYLTDQNNTIVDQVTFGEVPTDMSYAREPNGTGGFVVKGHTYSDNNNLVSATFDAIPASIKIYPNPTTDVLYIQSENDKNLDQVILYDQLNRVVYSSYLPVKSLTVNTLELPAGSYFLAIGGYAPEVIQIIK